MKPDLQPVQVLHAAPSHVAQGLESVCRTAALSRLAMSHVQTESGIASDSLWCTKVAVQGWRYLTLHCTFKVVTALAAWPPIQPALSLCALIGRLLPSGSARSFPLLTTRLNHNRAMRLCPTSYEYPLPQPIALRPLRLTGTVPNLLLSHCLLPRQPATSSVLYEHSAAARSLAVAVPLRHPLFGPAADLLLSAVACPLSRTASHP